MTDLASLIERVEAATEGSRELDGAVATSLDWWPKEFTRVDSFASWRRWTDVDSSWSECVDAPQFSTSIDAALTLLPEGLEFEFASLYGVAAVGMGINTESPCYARREDGNITLALLAAILASGLVTVAGENAVTLHQLRSNQFSHPHSDEASIRAALDQAIRSLDEIAAGHIPDCPLHYAGDELAWAQRHVGHLRRKAEIARDGITAAIRAGGDING